MTSESSKAILLRIQETVLQTALQHACFTYPEEGCGLFLENRETKSIDIFESISNIQNDLHRLDPARYSRDARKAYSMDEREVFALQRRYGKSHKICGVFHSHNDVGVYFSEEDFYMACPWGEPLYPERFYLIAGVANRTVQEASVFLWDFAVQEFIEAKMDLTHSRGESR